MQKIRDIIDEERRLGAPFSNFDSFVRRKPFEGLVKSVVESVKDFFPENQSEYGVFIGPPKEETKRRIEEEAEVEVDEALINQVVAEAEEEAKDTPLEDIDAVILDEGEEPADDVHPDEAIRLAKNKPDGPDTLQHTSSKGPLIESPDSEADAGSDEDDFDIPKEFFSKTAPKRLSSSIDMNPTPNKMRKIDLSFNSSFLSFNEYDSAQDKAPKDQSATPKGQSVTPRRTESQKTQSSFNGYQVVKNPGPETMLRLSQERSSQKSCVGNSFPHSSKGFKPFSTPQASFLSGHNDSQVTLKGQCPYLLPSCVHTCKV